MASSLELLSCKVVISCSEKDFRFLDSNWLYLRERF